MKLMHLIPATLLLFAGCVAVEEEAPATSEESDAVIRKVRIAWLGNNPSNTYDNAIRDNVAAVAAARNGSVSAFYALWDPATQLNQCLGAVQQNTYQAVIVLSDDSVGIIQCVTAARAAGIPVVAADLPIGHDMTTVEPQVLGQVGAVLIPPADWGSALSSLVVDRCANKNPCEVSYIAGDFGIALDAIALQDLDATAASHPNIRIVSRDEGFYTAANGYTITQTILANFPGIDVIIGAGDQMAQGAEQAIRDAGRPAGSIDIVGAGAGGYGVQAVKDGRWYATFVALPGDEGTYSGNMAIDAVRGIPITDPGVNPVQQKGYPPFFTRDNQGQFVGFVPQWPG